MSIPTISANGFQVETPTDPLHDPAFIKAINEAYDLGGPTSYPEEALVSEMNAHD